MSSVELGVKVNRRFATFRGKLQEVFRGQATMVDYLDELWKCGFIDERDELSDLPLESHSGRVGNSALLDYYFGRLEEESRGIEVTISCGRDDKKASNIYKFTLRDIDSGANAYVSIDSSQNTIRAFSSVLNGNDLEADRLQCPKEKLLLFRTILDGASELKRQKSEFQELMPFRLAPFFG